MHDTKTCIPQVNPQASYFAHKPAIDTAIERVMSSGRYVLGTEVAQLEKEFAAYCGSSYSVGVANGTDALTLALIAAGIGPGDTVATVSFTALATVAGVKLAGANIQAIDVDASGTMCPESLSTVLGLARGKIKAIVPVHLYGQMADMQKIQLIASEHNCVVIEDCAQAHGATRDGLRAGAVGLAGTFSFYPTKNLGAIGDGGAITTSDPNFKNKLMRLREYGWENRTSVEKRGMNSRLDELQAAILRAKLPALNAEIERRQYIAKAYDTSIKKLGNLTCLQRVLTSSHVFHQYVCITEDREKVRLQLSKAGIMTGIHYPIPVHKEPAWASEILLPATGLPSTEKLSQQIFSLPMFPQLTDKEVAHITNTLEE